MPASRFGTPRKYPCASTLRSNSFSFTHFRKNATANPLVSHTFKTKDLKPFRITHFQKKGGRLPHQFLCLIYLLYLPRSQSASHEFRVSCFEFRPLGDRKSVV